MTLDLREYFPDNAVCLLSRQDGSKHARYTLRRSPPGFAPLYNYWLNVGRPGTHYVWIKEYFISNAWVLKTNAVLFMGEDKSVIEVGDWTDKRTLFGYRDDSKTPTGLIWSPPGGLLPGVATTVEVNCWAQQQPGSAYMDHGFDAYSRSGLIEHLATYTPPFGCRNGVWSKEGGKTYTDVVHLVMYHGTRGPGWTPIRCSPPLSANGPYYQSFKDYNSYAIELWLARGVGIIQESTPFIEQGTYFGCPNCSGGIWSAPYVWTTFADEG